MSDQNKTTVEDTQAANKAKKPAAQSASNAVDKAKKAKDLWNKAKSVEALAPIITALSVVLIIIVVIVLLIGFIAFFITMPGLVSSQFIETAKSVWDWVTGNEEIKIDETNLVNLANYIEDLGYDIEGFGFAVSKSVIRENDEVSATGAKSKIKSIKLKDEDVVYTEEEQNIINGFSYMLESEREHNKEPLEFVENILFLERDILKDANIIRYNNGNKVEYYKAVHADGTNASLYNDNGTPKKIKVETSSGGVVITEDNENGKPVIQALSAKKMELLYISYDDYKKIKKSGALKDRKETELQIMGVYRYFVQLCEVIQTVKDSSMIPKNGSIYKIMNCGLANTLTNNETDIIKYIHHMEQGDGSNSTKEEFLRSEYAYSYAYEKLIEQAEKNDNFKTLDATVQVLYDATEELTKIQPKLQETFSVARKNLYAYVLANERTYTAVGLTNDLSGFAFGVGPGLFNLFAEPVKTAYQRLFPQGFGMLRFSNDWLDLFSTEGGSAKKGNFSVEIDRDTDSMIIKTKKLNGINEREEKMAWKLAGWTSRYGKPIELSLALHLSTFAPQFVYDFCMHRDLQTQVLIRAHKIKYDVEYTYQKPKSANTKYEPFYKNDRTVTNSSTGENVTEKGIISWYEELAKNQDHFYRVKRLLLDQLDIQLEEDPLNYPTGLHILPPIDVISDGISVISISDSDGSNKNYFLAKYATNEGIEINDALETGYHCYYDIKVKYETEDGVKCPYFVGKKKEESHNISTTDLLLNQSNGCIIQGGDYNGKKITLELISLRDFYNLIKPKGYTHPIDPQTVVDAFKNSRDGNRTINYIDYQMYSKILKEYDEFISDTMKNIILNKDKKILDEAEIQEVKNELQPVLKNNKIEVINAGEKDYLDTLGYMGNNWLSPISEITTFPNGSSLTRTNIYGIKNYYNYDLDLSKDGTMLNLLRHSSFYGIDKSKPKEECGGIEENNKVINTFEHGTYKYWSGLFSPQVTLDNPLFDKNSELKSLRGEPQRQFESIFEYFIYSGGLNPDDSLCGWINREVEVIRNLDNQKNIFSRTKKKILEEPLEEIHRKYGIDNTDLKELQQLYIAFKDLSDEIETYKPYIESVTHHWNRDLYFGELNKIDESVYQKIEGKTKKTEDFSPTEGTVGYSQITSLKEQEYKFGETKVKAEIKYTLTLADGNNNFDFKQVKNAEIKNDETWHYMVKNWLLYGYYFLYDGTVDTANANEAARVELEKHGFKEENPLLINISDDEQKTLFNSGTNASKIDEKAEEYNKILQDAGIKAKLQRIKFDKASSMAAFSILEGMHTEDSEYIYRELKEYLIELNYFTRADFEVLEKGVLKWLIPRYTVYKDEWPDTEFEKSSEQYGAFVRSRQSLIQQRKAEAESKKKNGESSTSITIPSAEREPITVSGITFANYSQKDSAWSGNHFSAGNIASSGCGPTSTATMLSGFGYNDLTPDVVAATIDAADSPFRTNDTCRAALKYAVEKLTDGNVKMSDTFTLNEDNKINVLKEALKEGRPVLMGTGLTGAGHIICLLGMDSEENVYCSDPADVVSSNVLPFDQIFSNWVINGNSGYTVALDVPTGYTGSRSSGRTALQGFAGQLDIIAPENAKIVEIGTNENARKMSDNEKPETTTQPPQTTTPEESEPESTYNPNDYFTTNGKYITLQFKTANAVNNWKMTIEGLDIDESLSEGKYVKQKKKIGTTTDDNIRIVLYDDKDAVINDVEDYFKLRKRNNGEIDEDMYKFFFFTIYESGTYDMTDQVETGTGPECVGACRPGAEHGAGICQWTTMSGCNNIEYLCRRLYEKDKELCAPLQKYIGKGTQAIIDAGQSGDLKKDFRDVANGKDSSERERMWELEMEIAYEDFMNRFDELGLSWIKDRPACVQGTLASLVNWGPYLGWENAIDSNMDDEEIIISLCQYACGFTSTVGSLNHRWNPQAKLALDILDEEVEAEEVLRQNRVAAKYSTGKYGNFLSEYDY